jgi:hypothetical protein
MDDEHKNRILNLLNNRAPNWVSEITFDANDINVNEDFQGAVKKLQDEGFIEKKVDPRSRIAQPMNYYRVTSFKNLPIRDYIQIGNRKVPRLLTEGSPGFLPEDFNEAIEQLAKYAKELESRLENRIKEQQRSYWAKTISVFSILAALLAIILGNTPRLNTNQFYYQGFWNSLGRHFSLLIPFCSILIVFALLMWFILRDTRHSK